MDEMGNISISEQEDKEYTLEFCAHCGLLLTDIEDLDAESEPLYLVCDNCGSDVEPIDYRCRGKFSSIDAHKLASMTD